LIIDRNITASVLLITCLYYLIFDSSFAVLEATSRRDKAQQHLAGLPGVKKAMPETMAAKR